MTIFRRLWAYGQKRFALSEALDGVRERPGRAGGRRQPRIPTGRVVGSWAVMALLRLGSLHGLDQRRGRRIWRRTIGAQPASARTNGRVADALECDDLRGVLRHVYARRKRTKALGPFCRGLIALILDGHESSASFLRCCPGCLRRTIHTAHGDRTQFYHRLVVGTLLCGGGVRVPLDCEMQRPGEDEVACALRLFDRMVRDYPRAFDLVGVDGLYLRADFFNAVARRHKGVIAVLKDEQRNLMVDARALFEVTPPQRVRLGRTRCECWDIEGFRTWERLDTAVRVVRSVEHSSVRRQCDGAIDEKTSEWMWATNIDPFRLPTEGVLRFGHGRWAIENEGGFNELVNLWHADHVYKHTVNAILAFWLIALLAYNIFHAFIGRNLKPILRAAHTAKYFAEQIAAEFDRPIDARRSWAPP